MTISENSKTVWIVIVDGKILVGIIIVDDMNLIPDPLFILRWHARFRTPNSEKFTFSASRAGQPGERAYHLKIKTTVNHVESTILWWLPIWHLHWSSKWNSLLTFSQWYMKYIYIFAVLSYFWMIFFLVLILCYIWKKTFFHKLHICEVLSDLWLQNDVQSHKCHNLCDIWSHFGALKHLYFRHFTFRHFTVGVSPSSTFHL